MKNTIFGLFAIGVLLIGLMTLTAATPAHQFVERAQMQQPVIKKLPVYKGDIFKNFAEFRVQQSSFSTLGILTLVDEPYEMLININQIVKVHRFEDGKKTDYSCLMFISEDKHPRGIVPVLVREQYKDVLKRMKRAIETR